MVFFEYDAEAEKRVIYKDGVEEGRAKEIVRSCKDFNLSKEDAIHKLELYYQSLHNLPLTITKNFQRNLKMNSQKHKNYVKGVHWYELF